MEIRKLLKWMATGLLLFATPIFYLNVENVAQRLGYDKLMADAVAPQGQGASMLQWLTGPTAFACALVALGLFLGVWLDYFARRWDRRASAKDRQLHELWPSLREISHRLRDIEAGWEYDGPEAELFSVVLAKKSTLIKLGVPTPSLDPKDGEAWFRGHRLYFSCLWPALEAGHVREAITVATSLTNTMNEIVAEKRRLSPNTGSKE